VVARAAGETTVHSSIEQHVAQMANRIDEQRMLRVKALVIVLLAGRPMLTLNDHADLMRSTRHPNFSPKLWSQRSAWRDAKKIETAIVQRSKALIAAAPFFAWSCDESMDIGKGSRMTLHVYIVHNWERMSIFVALVKVNMPADAKSLKQQLQSALETEAGLTEADVLARGCMFAADGASVLQGKVNGVTTRFRRDVPKLLPMHCMAHRVQLAAKSTANCWYMCCVLTLTTMSAKLYSKSAARVEVCSPWPSHVCTVDSLAANCALHMSLVQVRCNL
jgi:hypothetical protein